jgi:hypothetical protein
VTRRGNASPAPTGRAVSEGQKPTVPNAEPGDDPNLSKPIYNWLSIFGGVTAVGSLTSVVFFFLCVLNIRPH